MSEIKKVTLEQLAKLDSWKMRDVDKNKLELLQRNFKNNIDSADLYSGYIEFLEIYFGKENKLLWTSNIKYFDNKDIQEVELIEENQTKKVNLQYLLDNDKWQLKVTPEQSKMVQLALFDVGVKWNNSKPKTVIHTDAKWLERSDNVIYYGCGFNDNLIELEEKKPQNDFETQQDLIKWLSSDNKIEITYGGKEIVSFIDGVTKVHNQDGSFRRVSYSFDEPQNWKKVTNWYDKLDGSFENGRLCWVGGNEDNLSLKRKVELILSYRNHEQFSSRFKGSLSWWEYATPLTNDEIKSFMVGGSDE